MYLDSKTLNKMGIEQMYLKYDKPTAHIILNSESASSKIRNKTRMSNSYHST